MYTYIFTDNAALRLRNDLYCVEWGVKLYSLTLCGRCTVIGVTLSYI